jgi:prepilin-type N-terminal cleavage/methylation domain-containing protein
VADVESRCEVVQGDTSARRDRGFSMVEVIVTITLAAVVIVPIMFAVVATIKSSSQGRSAAQVETTLVNAADRVNRAEMECDYSMYVEAAVRSQGWTADQASVRHSHYVPTSSTAEPGEWVDAACESGMSGPSDGLVQRIVISVTSPDGDIRQEMQVVKSDA